KGFPELHCRLRGGMRGSMKFRIAVCDDEQTSLLWLEEAAAAWAKERQYRVELVPFSSAEGFLFAYGENRAFDILLLDVEMKGMSGLELAKQLRQDGLRAEIVFITSHFELCGEGYEVDALHYLVKPVSKERLNAVLDRAAQRLSVEAPSVVIACDGETIKLPEQDILYVEAFLHYVAIYTAAREYRVHENFSAFEAKLSDDFFRPHRSYLVSLKHVTRISRTQVWLDNGAALPLARGKYDDINRAFIEHN
ncbi:MAG: LytTR family DNA-binding domain-containing protein, partial [Lachnospiraceae bacterium]|nr:LytTR family DNA-binding domain-containing protein [Lachnospiraceae bacterium]